MSDNKSTDMPATDDAIIFSEPTDSDFEDDIPEEEKEHYKNKFKDLNTITQFKLHCTSCDKHLGCAPKSEQRMRTHPMLRTLVCQQCQAFYNSGEFEKGDDGSELYCRWCGQGGQVFCCSQCPHVFCAKCIRRNLGPAKVRQIENTDDWKCFKCEPEDLYDLRALCWAVLRYCDLKNKFAYKTQDPELKDKYQKECSVDNSTCCKEKNKRRSFPVKKKENEETTTKKPADLLSKFPPTIQVKKFALIPDETKDEKKDEKKAEKRKISPVKNKVNFMKNPVLPSNYYYPKPGVTPVKRPKLLPKVYSQNPSGIMNMGGFHPSATIRPMGDKRMLTGQIIKLPAMRPILPMPVRPMGNIPNHMYNNGYNMIPNDNINLSLESLTQGLDFASVAAMDNNINNDVVCTPDFPLEPLCEVTEDTNDDDVECITPAPIAAPKNLPVKSQLLKRLQDPSNIVQMTENDVSVNSATGGLKFRVDPQTLSANKMYRLPDGRVFAINPNPKMPGGYSATIVSDGNKLASGKTFAAKLSAVTSVSSQKQAKAKNTTPPKKTVQTRARKAAPANNKDREVNLDVPVEWYRYNLIDAIDSLEYSVMRLQRLKTEATMTFLRTRKVDEMQMLHKTLERILNNSSTRFEEIRTSLNAGLKSYLNSKNAVNEDEANEEEDDDDVQILPDNTDDPIYIDENSRDADDVQLLSDLNDSAEKDKDETIHNTNKQTDFNDSEAATSRDEVASPDNDVNDTEDNDDEEDQIKDDNDVDVSKKKIDDGDLSKNDNDEDISKNDNEDEVKKDVENLSKNDNEDKVKNEKEDEDKEESGLFEDDDEEKISNDIKQNRDDDNKEKEIHQQLDDDDKQKSDDNNVKQDKNDDMEIPNNKNKKHMTNDKDDADDKMSETSINGDTEKMDVDNVDPLNTSNDNEVDLNKQESDKSKDADLDDESIDKLLKDTPNNPDMEEMPSLEEFQDQSILST